MEKFSAYRDAGTGIQPFLKPLPPLGSDSTLATVTVPLRYVLSVVRLALMLVLVLVYLILSRVVGLVLAPIAPLYRAFDHFCLVILGYPFLFLSGVFGISAEYASAKKTKSLRANEIWNLKRGDLIMSNWVSWVEVLWLAIRFNPVFVVSCPSDAPTSTQSTSSNPVTHTPGRRAVSAAQLANSKSDSSPIPVVGYRVVSLLSLISLTGNTPIPVAQQGHKPSSLEKICKEASQPVVLFPEGTTSNGRGLLRFAKDDLVLPEKSKIFILCVRYDPPTALAPSAASPIPVGSFNPLPHLIALTASFTIAPITIRMLNPSESPSPASEESSDASLMETCALLMSQIGKLKRIGLGWEDKVGFLEFYNRRNK